MKKRPLLVVEWEDTLTEIGWQPESDSLKWTTVHCFSVGWQLKGTRKALILGTTRDVDGHCNGQIVIPRGCITKIRRLE